MCIVDGCERSKHGQGYCNMHLRRLRKAGLVSPTPKYASLKERLMAYADMSGGEHACWPWTKSLNARGYGQVRGDYDAPVLAHRAMYELLVGPIPQHLVYEHVCHSDDPGCAGGDDCLHRRCVNPAHGELTTQQVNMARSVQGFAHKGTCQKGHPIDSPADYRIDQKGNRRCKRCTQMTRGAP